jgi:8-oxo-dGTP diphosphatase
MNDVNKINSFNIRVYGLFINNDNQILLADEERFGMKMTKFPGGGLQFGEGLIDCLKREGMEEFGQKIEVLEHFYTTDYFQKALFHESQQLISIYYRAKFPEKEKFRIALKPFDFIKPSNKEPVSFRYIALNLLDETDFSFPIDRHVVKLLKNSNTIKFG